MAVGVSTALSLRGVHRGRRRTLPTTAPTSAHWTRGVREAGGAEHLTHLLVAIVT